MGKAEHDVSASNPGQSHTDVGFVPAVAGHSIETAGTEDPVFLELFSMGEFQEMSLNKWLRTVPRQVAMAHTNLLAEEIARIPANGNPIV